MKRLLFLLFVLFGAACQAQTSVELIGRWQLVKWVQHGEEKDINSYFKTDKVYQVFMENGKFESVADSTHKGKWKLSEDNRELTITTTLIPIKFRMDYFDKEKRVMSYEQLGTFEYKKVAP